MSEVLARREEVAAKRAALTDGRWRNREGIGMYQRSTSNALRDMLAGLGPAQPTQPVKPPARTKSRSRSRSPRKRKSVAAEIHHAGPSRTQTEDIFDEAPTPKSPARPIKSPIRRKSIVSSSLRAVQSPARPKSISKSKAKTPAKAKSKKKAAQDDESEPEMSVAALLKQRRAKLAEEEAARGEEQVDDDAGVPNVPESTAKRKPVVEEVEDSVVLLPDDHEEQEQEPEEEQPEPPKAKAKAKSRIQTIIPEPIQPATSKPKKRIEDPKRDAKPAAKAKGKGGRGKKKKDAEEDDDEEPVTRRLSGTKRAAPSDDEDEREDGPSADSAHCPPKRSKTKANPPKKAKAKPKAKSKAKASKRTSASATPIPHIELDSPEPEPEPELPEAQDIMVPLQDSPRPKSKSTRRRYTLMPVRSQTEMADPDYDPMDCIGWQ